MKNLMFVFALLFSACASTATPAKTLTYEDNLREAAAIANDPAIVEYQKQKEAHLRAIRFEDCLTKKAKFITRTATPATAQCVL